MGVLPQLLSLLLSVLILLAPHSSPSLLPSHQLLWRLWPQFNMQRWTAGTEAGASSEGHAVFQTKNTQQRTCVGSVSICAERDLSKQAEGP